MICTKGVSNNMIIKRLGTFGEFAKEYERARRPYPKETFNFVAAYAGVDNPMILDMGCGTGISTRQLAAYGKVTGCDPDPRMLRAAKKHKKINGEKYIVGTAECIPCKDSSVDAVTAFAAFHWFDNAKALGEIMRVLRPGGVFCVVNKTGLKSWGNGYRGAIIKTIGREIARFKEDSYNPRRSLRKFGFKRVTVRTWKKVELFDVENALEYVQSVSIWNSVPASLRSKALAGLGSYFSAMKKKTGKIERRLVVRAVLGRK